MAFVPAEAGQANAAERQCDLRTPQEQPVSQRERSLRARLATEYRRRERAPERIVDLRRQLAAQQIRDHITRILAAAPPLTISQRRELADVVLGGDADGTDAA